MQETIVIRCYPCDPSSPKYEEQEKEHGAFMREHRRPINAEPDESYACVVCGTKRPGGV